MILLGKDLEVLVMVKMTITITRKYQQIVNTMSTLTSRKRLKSSLPKSKFFLRMKPINKPYLKG